MAKISRREKELMLSTGIMIIKSIEETIGRAEKEKMGEEFIPGMRMSVQLILGILKGLNENIKDGDDNGTN